MSRDFLKLSEGSLGAGGRSLFSEDSIVGRETYLGWPVDAYRIFIPVVNEDGMGGEWNSFERLVISVVAMDNPLINADRMLAEMTCLPEDFVHDIVLRLSGRGVFCEDKLKLTSKFKAQYQISKSKGEDPEPTELKTAFVFREAVTGRMLPHLMLLGDKPIETMDYDAVARRRPIMVRRQQQAFPAPDAKDVRRVISDMRSRNRDYGASVSIPTYAHFDIIPTPEQYYLMCPIGMRRYLAEERIGDPFGLGYSLVLEAAFREAIATDDLLAKKISEWEKRLEQSDEGVDEESAKKDLPFNVKHVAAAYPNLANALRHAYTGTNIRDLYAAVEWSLFYHLAEEAKAIVIAINSMNASEFTHAVDATLARLGWQNQSVSRVKPVQGKILDFETGRNTEFPVSLAILLSCEGAKGKLLDRFNNEFGSNFLAKMFAMRAYRDTKRHGAKLDHAQEISFDEARPFVEKVIRMALPDVQFAEGAALPSDNDAKTDEKIRATNDLHAIYGRNVVWKFPTVVKEHLIEAQKDWNKTNAADDVSGAVVEVGAAMQAMLVHVLGEYAPLRVEQAVTKARTRVISAGFSDFPMEVYQRINPDRIRNGLRGKIPTLGVAGVVMALCADDDHLSALAERMPEMFAFIAEVHQVGGHGGKSVFLDEEDRRRWQTWVKNFIETLMEAYNG